MPLPQTLLADPPLPPPCIPALWVAPYDSYENVVVKAAFLRHVQIWKDPCWSFGEHPVLLRASVAEITCLASQPDMLKPCMNVKRSILPFHSEN